MVSANQEYANRLKAHFEKAYKMPFEKGVKAAFIMLGQRTWHDSSRAASNWQVVGPNNLAMPYKDTRGKAPVGKRGEKRSMSGNSSAIELVAMETALKYTKMIVNDIWQNDVAEFFFYNAVEDHPNPIEADEYFERAGIQYTEGDVKVKRAFDTAAAAAFKEWEQLPLGGRK